MASHTVESRQPGWVGPAFKALRNSVHCTPNTLPWASLQIGGDVPPLDAKAVMGAMVLGKAEHLAGQHLGKSAASLPRPAKLSWGAGLCHKPLSSNRARTSTP